MNFTMNPSAAHNPVIPFCGAIPGGVTLGKIIEIYGQAPHGAQSFNFNLSAGRNQGSRKADIPLHISIRFNDRTVVRNTFHNQHWGAEEKHGLFPFSTGKQFTVVILVEADCFRIAVNGQHYCEYRHRLAYASITMLGIEGNVQIAKIEYNNQRNPVPFYYPSQNFQYMNVGMGRKNRKKFNQHWNGPNCSHGCCSSHCHECYSSHCHECCSSHCHGFYPQGSQGCIPPPAVTPPRTFEPVLNPSIPFTYPIYGGLYPGMMIYISGRPSASIHRFTINLQCGTAPYPPPDIAFHMDVRYHNKTVVRNTRRNDKWDAEELSLPYFPFQPAVYFDMIIRVENDKYMIALNGQHFVEYRHRIFPLLKINTLVIENDVIVSSIRVT